MTEDHRVAEVPDAKDPVEYSYRERCAELLSLIEEAGGSRPLNYAAYGRRYDVSREQVRKDVQCPGSYLSEAANDDVATLEGEAFLWRYARELLEDEEYWKAAQTFLDLEEWRRQSDLEDLLEHIEALEQEERESESPLRVKQMAGPIRRDVERAIRQYQEQDCPGDAGGSPGDVKLLVGVSLDVFDLPAEAREYIEEATALDHSALIVAADDESAEDAAHTLGLPDAGREAGFEAEAFLVDVQDGDDDSVEGD